MAIRLSLLLLLTVACGKQVTLSSNKLESYNTVTTADSIKVDKTGTLIRKNINSTSDRITTGGQTLAVSKYSSHQALTAISSRAEGITVPVRYKGEIKGSEIVLELLEYQ